MTYTVYRVFDPEGADLLYVGMTKNLDMRLAAHSKSKSWWPTDPSLVTEEFEDVEEAADREVEIALTEAPVHNRRAQRYPAEHDRKPLELDDQIVFRLNSQFRKRFQALAEEAERTESQEIRRALRLHLEAGQL